MKTTAIWAIGALLFVAVIGVRAAFSPSTPAPQEAIQWVSIQQAAELSATDGKKILIDLYTDWCGWCKKLDKETYTDPQVVAYINAHFHAVKFDAEQKGEVVLQGKTFSYIPDLGRNGSHELAARLMNGKLSYPTTVFLEPNLAMITPVPGYHHAKDMQTILAFVATEAYKTQSFEAFKAAFQGSR